MAAKEASRLRGVLDGQDLARMFAWMRPNDLIWNYWVNNYLLGNAPPAFDILYWNADTTRLPARLHGDYIDLYFTNPFVNAGRLTLDGRTVDMGRVKGKVDDLCRGRPHGPHHAVEGGVQHRAHPRRRGDLRPFEQRASAEPSQSADKQEGVLHDRRGDFSWSRSVPLRARRSGREAGGSIGATGCANDPAPRSTRRVRLATSVTPSSRRPRGATSLSDRAGLAPDETAERPAGVEARMMSIGGQELMVAVKRGSDSRRPLLLFNGIGANWELARPFLEALTAHDSDHLRHAWDRRLSSAEAAVSSVEHGPAWRPPRLRPWLS